METAIIIILLMMLAIIFLLIRNAIIKAEIAAKTIEVLKKKIKQLEADENRSSRKFQEIINEYVTPEVFAEFGFPTALPKLEKGIDAPAKKSINDSDTEEMEICFCWNCKKEIDAGNTFWIVDKKLIDHKVCQQCYDKWNAEIEKAPKKKIIPFLECKHKNTIPVKTTSIGNGKVIHWECSCLDCFADKFNGKWISKEEQDKETEYVNQEIRRLKEQYPKESRHQIWERFNKQESRKKKPIDNVHKYYSSAEIEKMLLNDIAYEELNEKLEIHTINQSGYAGVMPNGNIVDRREHPEAKAVPKNTLLGLPEPKEIDSYCGWHWRYHEAKQTGSKFIELYENNNFKIGTSNREKEHVVQLLEKYNVPKSEHERLINEFFAMAERKDSKFRHTEQEVMSILSHKMQQGLCDDDKHCKECEISKECHMNKSNQPKNEN